MIKLIISDLDGTLLHDGENASGGILEENLNQIAKWQDNGIKFMCASGRPAVYRDVLNTDYGMLWDFIGDNGCTIILNDELIYSNEISRDTVLAFTELMKQYKDDLVYSFSLLGDYRVFSRYNSFHEKYASPVIKDHKQNCTVEEYISLGIPILPNRFFLVVDDNDKIEKLCQVINKQFEGVLSAVTSGPHYIEVMNKGQNKGNGIRIVAEKLGLGLDEIIVVGDAENDIPMLELIPNSFVMDHASDLVKGKGKYLVSHVYEIDKWIENQ